MIFGAGARTRTVAELPERAEHVALKEPSSGAEPHEELAVAVVKESM